MPTQGMENVFLVAHVDRWLCFKLVSVVWWSAECSTGIQILLLFICFTESVSVMQIVADKHPCITLLLFQSGNQI